MDCPPRPPSRQEDTETIVNALGRLIIGQLARAASEQYHPSADVDRSDGDTADALEKAAKLRAIRDSFETAITGAIIR